MTNFDTHASLSGRLTYPNGDVFHIRAPRVSIVPVEGNAPQLAVDLRMEASEGEVIYGVSNKPSYNDFIEALAKALWDPTEQNITLASAHLAVEDWRDRSSVLKALIEKLS